MKTQKTSQAQQPLLMSVIKTGGKQYLVKPSDIVMIEKIDGEPGTRIVAEEILLYVDEERCWLNPTDLKNVQVELKILEQLKGPKIKGLRYKPKSRYRRRYGHRQAFTKVEISKIIAKSVTKKAGPKKKMADKPVKDKKE